MELLPKDSELFNGQACYCTKPFIYFMGEAKFNTAAREKIVQMQEEAASFE